MKEEATEYHYGSADAAHTHAYLWQPVFEAIQNSSAKPTCIFELGCGNGAFAEELSKAGFDVTGVDPSIEGITVAEARNQQGRFEVGSAYDDLEKNTAASRF